MKNQKGFAVLEGLLILVIIAMLAGIGWYVHSSADKTNKTLNEATNSVVQPSKKSSVSNTNPASSDQKYLVIKEWGMKLPLDSNTSDAYYAPDDSKVPPDQMALSLDSLKNTQCKAGGWPPALIFRYTSTQTDPVSGDTLVSQFGTANKVGDYYYAVTASIGADPKNGCMSTNSDQVKASNAAASFKNNLSGLVKE